MPQDIPLEASETLAFTPNSLAALPSPPTFTLRAPTPRERRWMRLLIQEEGAIQHTVEALRAEMLKALPVLWGKESAAQHIPVIEAYWEAEDIHALQLRDNPDLKWEYDAQIEAAVRQLEIDVAQAWKPFARMRAGNAYAAEISMLAVVAVTVTGWTGLDVAPAMERGYLTIDSVSAAKDVLGNLDREGETGKAWAELVAACSKRMFLSADTEKNSASPSPSEPPPPSSKAKADGTSPASAPSSKTRETA